MAETTAPKTTRTRTKKEPTPKLTNGDIPEVVSTKTVSEALAKAQMILPTLAAGTDVDPAVAANLAAKIAVMPMVTTSMSRKVNTGDYENLDFFFSIATPIGLTEAEHEVYADLIGAAIQQGIDVINPEVNVRYTKVKKAVEKMQKAKR